MEKDYVIDQVSWHTEVTGNTETVEHIHQRFRILINFLQEKKLTSRILLEKDSPVPDDFSFKLSDLTNDGFKLIKKCYDKWLQGLDSGKDVNDLKIFEKELAKMN